MKITPTSSSPNLSSTQELYSRGMVRKGTKQQTKLGSKYSGLST